jgi:hypothetical protein
MTKITYILILVIFAFGCKKPYNPAVSTSNVNILVVEGMINTGGADSTIIKLSRTGIVNNKKTANLETAAIVTVENSQGTVFTLAEITKGTYAAPPVNLDNTKQYRLRVKTSNGKIYWSDFADVKVTPPIDSIGYTIQNNGMQIYANTHDPNNNTHYYKYTYRETWQFNARYMASYITDGRTLSVRTAAQQVFYCFGTDTSTYTIINSTAALAKDIAYQVPIIAIDFGSEKLGTKYSILLRQQALTKEAYAFFENLKKNTESLGSIFDAQPSQLIGNIHNSTDPSEPVIGYISAGTTQQKRIYITKQSLPANFHVVYPYGCEIDSAYNMHNPNIPHPFYTDEWLTPYPPAGLALIPFINANNDDGYLFSSIPCTDCTIRGTTQQPAFWK